MWPFRKRDVPRQTATDVRGAQRDGDWVDVTALVARLRENHPHSDDVLLACAVLDQWSDMAQPVVTRHVAVDEAPRSTVADVPVAPRNATEQVVTRYVTRG